MHLRLGGLTERLRASLFFLPSVFVVLAVVLAGVTLNIDEQLADDALPRLLTTTVGSAQAVVGTVAAATITFAGVAFSIALLIIQLASSQYSPRVVYGLFRDPFNRRVIGVVVGTFTYCLLILLEIRDPPGDGVEAIVPNLSVSVAVVFGVGSVLAVVAFINHAAHSMDISRILQRIADSSLERIELEPELPREGTVRLPGSPDDRGGPPGGAGTALHFGANGWVQDVDAQALVALAPPGGVVRLDTAPGRYAVGGTPLCTVWPALADDGARAEAEVRANRAVHIGRTRTMQMDNAYGIRQLADVALKALSPSMNDPTTAQDAIFHLAAVLRSALTHAAPLGPCEGEAGRLLVTPQVATSDDLVALAYDELRVAAAPQPTVCVYLLESMELVADALVDAGYEEVPESIRRQAELVVEEAERAPILEHDRMRVRRAYTKRFGDGRAGRAPEA